MEDFLSVLCFSGGKDSTASVILAHENNIPIDYIVFSEVMYDNSRGISGENPQHIEFIKNKAIPIMESWGYKVVILHSEDDYLSCFNKIIKTPRKYKENQGLKRGFPLNNNCMIQRDCKIKPMNDFLSKLGKPYIKYLGIAIDEPKRLASLHLKDNQFSLLEMFGYTEQMAYDLCKKYDLLSPVYKITSRNGCFMCPNARLKEMQEIKETYPEVWQEFIKLEDNTSNLAGKKWNIFKKTLREIDEEIEYRKNHIQLSLFDFL